MVLNNWLEVESSSISRVRFRNNNFDVEFKESGKIFRYYNFPLETYNEFMNSSSIGKFFLKNIRGKYSDSKITINDLEIKLEELKSGKTTIVEFSKFLTVLLKEGLSENELVNLSISGDVSVRSALAYLDSLPGPIMESLAVDPSLDVKRKLALRNDLTPEAITRLRKSGDLEILTILTGK